MVHDLGGMAYIPFKSNNVAGEAGSLWEKMFHYYSLNKDEFLDHYHKRSNVESTFSMVKAMFRDSVRSKTKVAMKNEVLGKFLGVTDPPLRGKGEEHLTGDEVTVRMETLRFVRNALLLEIVPVAADPHTAQVQHGLRPGQRPVHARALHTIFDEVPARAFDHATGNRIALTEVFAIVHAVAILVEVTTDTSQRLLFRARQTALLGDPAQRPNYRLDFPFQHLSHTLTHKRQHLLAVRSVQ